MENHLEGSYNAYHTPNIRPAIPSQVLIQMQRQIYMHVRTDNQMFLAASFITNRNWKELKHAALSESIKTLYHVRSMEYCCIVKETNC